MNTPIINGIINTETYANFPVCLPKLDKLNTIRKKITRDNTNNYQYNILNFVI